MPALLKRRRASALPPRHFDIARTRTWLRSGYFPSLNLAASAITLGAVCLLVDELIRVRRANG